MALDTISREEFEIRLDAANERLRQELADAQTRVQHLERLIQRKEAFSQKLDQILADIERDEAEIAAAEQKLFPRRGSRRRPHTASVSA